MAGAAFLEPGPVQKVELLRTRRPAEPSGRSAQPWYWEVSEGRRVWWSERSRERLGSVPTPPRAPGMREDGTLGKSPAHVEGKGAEPSHQQGLSVIRSGLLTASHGLASSEEQLSPAGLLCPALLFLRCLLLHPFLCPSFHPLPTSFLG